MFSYSKRNWLVFLLWALLLGSLATPGAAERQSAPLMGPGEKAAPAETAARQSAPLMGPGEKRAPGEAGERETADPFTIRAQAVPARIPIKGRFMVGVWFAVPKGHLLYADPIELTPRPDPAFAFGPVQKPKPKQKDDPQLGPVAVYSRDIALKLPVTVLSAASPGPKTVVLEAAYQGCAGNHCFFPQKKSLSVPVTLIPPNASDSADPRASQAPDALDSAERAGAKAPETAKPGVSAGEDGADPFGRAARRFGLIGVLAAAFVWGFFTSLTPCVYPMIPITVGVIGASTAGNPWRGFFLSVLYVLGMSVTYAILGVAAAWSGGLFGAYSGHPAVRITVAAIFVLLALGMFDLIYIQLPSSLSSRLGGTAGAGTIGVFLTGAVAGAVVGPCVGPMLAGLLVYVATLGDKLQGFLIMWSFSLGMGLLFLAIGTFSGAATALPKAGGWMERLKDLFGVLFLGAALYYLQPLLPLPVFGLILGALLIGLGVFVGALDGIGPETGRARRFWKAVGIVLLTVGVGYVIRFPLADTLRSPGPSPDKAGIAWLSDESVALSRARAGQKPVLIDFYADWCAACRKLDARTFAHPAVIAAARDWVCLKVDGSNPDDPQFKRLQEKYAVVGLPTLVFLTPQGRRLPQARITAYIGPEPFVAQMEKIAARF